MRRLALRWTSLVMATFLSAVLLNGLPPSFTKTASAQTGANPLSITTFAGNGADATVEGTGTQASFRQMGGLVIVGSHAYVGTYGSIRKVNITSQEVTTLAGHPTQVGCTDGTASQSRFENVYDVASDGTYLYTVGNCGYMGQSRIARTSIATGATTTILTTFTALGYLTLGPDGMIYTSGGQGIERIDPATGAMTTFASVSGNNYAITADAAYIWVAWLPTNGTNTIERYALDASHTPFFSHQSVGITALESVGSDLYTTAGVNRIRRYVKADASYATLAGTDTYGYADGTGTDSWFHTINGIASDGTNLFISDNGNRRFRKGVTASTLPSVQSSLVTQDLGMNLASVSAPAGSGTNATVDGVGTAASFRDMGGVTVEGDYAYVGTRGSIRRVNLTTKEVTTFAGHATATGCEDSTNPSQVRFEGITDIDTDGYYLYTAGACGIYGTTRLRRTSLATGATSTIATGINQHKYLTFGPDQMIYSTGGGASIWRTHPVEGTVSTFSSQSGGNHAITSDDQYIWVARIPSGPPGTPVIERYTTGGAKTTFDQSGTAGHIALESAGNYLYAGAAPALSSVRVYDKGSGAWINVAGNGYGYANGVGLAAKFAQIHGIASDGTNLWITEYGNYRLRKAVQAQPADSLFGACGQGDVAWTACHLESDPVNTATGNFYRTETDATLPGIGIPFSLVRHYNSLDATTGPLGPGWTHSYNLSLTVQQNGDALVRLEDGKKMLFARQPNGSYYGGPGVRAGIARAGSDYLMTTNSQVTYRFNSQGRLLSIKDRNGQGPTLTYNGQNQLSSITDSAGRVINLTYNNGLLTSVGLPGGRSVGYAYTGGRLTSATDLRGGITSYTYDGNGRLATVTDPNNHTVVQNTYGGNGRVISQLDALNHEGTFAWDAQTETSTYTDAHGKTWIDDYDNSLLVRQTDPLGNSTSYGYTGMDLTRVTNPHGNTTKLAYDSRGNLTSMTAPAPLSYLESFTYNTRNDLTSHTDGRGNATTYGYDAAGNLTSVTRPGSNLTQFGRDPGGTGLLTSITDPRGKTTTFEYDTQGNLTKTTTALGHKTTMGYDASGRMTSLVEPRGNVQGANPDDYRWTFTYDSGNHLSTRTDPLSNRTEWTYDNAGNLSSVIDAKNRTTSYGYNAADELTSVNAPGNIVTAYAYDEVGNLIRRTDAKNHITTYGYDPARRLASVTSPTNQLWTYEYDPAGNVTKVVTALGNSTPEPSDGQITYSYDVLNRPIAIDYSDATPDVTLSYDSNSNRTQMADGAGTESYTWDTLDRLTQVTRGSDSFSYAYDPADNVTMRTYPDATVIDYTYDDHGRTATVTSGGATTTYGYDPAGNLTATSLPASNGHVETRTYDRAGRLTEVKNAKGQEVLSRFIYTLDAVGNPTQAVTPTETTTYSYDSLDRLTEVCHQASCPGPTDPFIRYAYDPVGNRTTETRPSGSTTYTYNDADQLTSSNGPGGTVNYAHDQNGNQTQAGARTFGYDLANRMVSTSSGGSTLTYSYDGDGKRLEASSGPQPQDKTRYLWDPNWPLYTLAQERDGNNTLRRRYVHGRDLISMNPGGSESYYHYDALGSVSNLTSNTGTAQWTFTYEPFGTIRTQTGSGPTNLMRFTGELFDEQTGLYHLRARQYDSTTGRFLATDPLAPMITDPYVASYVYAINRPTMLVDPAGLRGEMSMWEDLWSNPVEAWKAGLPEAAELYEDVIESFIDVVVQYGQSCAEFGLQGATTALPLPGYYWAGFAAGCGVGVLYQIGWQEVGLNPYEQ